MVTEGIRRINREKRGCSLVKMDPTGKNRVFSFIFLLVFQHAQTLFLKFVISIWYERKSPCFLGV